MTWRLGARLESGIDRMKAWVLGTCRWVWNRREGANGLGGWSLRLERWVLGLQEGPLESRGMKEVLSLSEGSPKVSQQIAVESSLSSVSHP